MLPGFLPGRKQAVEFPPSPPAASLLSLHPFFAMHWLVAAQLGNKQRINRSMFLLLSLLHTTEHSSVTHHSLEEESDQLPTGTSQSPALHGAPLPSVRSGSCTDAGETELSEKSYLQKVWGEFKLCLYWIVSNVATTVLISLFLVLSVIY